ncbi:bifunctional riboflavin kinase/FAD synthetase [Kangiella sp. HZ709]|uniref:bifunctional riboflavin kinase/FAD synthetase n=1 Tax=Kangiella sp. HZ709 TaxID=2666328 RepID=UPI0012B00422|nr:bifunctional riboflavin kinase/FAD synthetase [Kangiella sp. HZ709]MRX27105.1 bifunctional riboflavin kinase/FAD synthetase [Kangiella sp. HZ709]
MRLLRGLYNCPEQLFTKGCVGTIGNFDGVHLGHQAIIKRLTAKANDLNLPSVVVLFEPHAQEFFCPTEAPARLFKLTDKIEALKELGVDFVLCLRFAEELANLSAEDFVRRVLVERLKVKHLFIGDDFRFGHQRKGDFELLKSYNFVVEANQSVTFPLNGELTGKVRISSSKVRQEIARGNFDIAEALLGRSYQIAGKVAHGQKQGRKLGFATANINLKRLQSPLKGVYAVRVTIVDANTNSNESLKGVANVGVKPTLGDYRERLEIHLLDFAESIYGKKLTVQPLKKIRDEQKFATLDLLKEQIEKDIQTAKHYFKNQY